MSKLAEKLQRFLALATIQPHEDSDDGRNNEARNAAMALLRTCRDNKVKIKFVLPHEEAGGSGTEDAEDFFERVNRERRAAQEAADRRRRERELDERARREREEHQAKERERRERQAAWEQPKPKSKPKPKEEPRIIEARFGGRCTVCMCNFAVGEKVYWERAGCSHTRCGVS